MEAASRCEKDVRVVLVEWEGHREGTENVEGEGYDVGREPVRWDMMELEVLRGGGGGLVQVRKVVERWGVVGDAWESEERGGGND